MDNPLAWPGTALAVVSLLAILLRINAQWTRVNSATERIEADVKALYSRLNAHVTDHAKGAFDN